MDLARAPRRAPLTARKMGSGYENGSVHENTISFPEPAILWKETKAQPRTQGSLCVAAG